MVGRLHGSDAPGRSLTTGGCIQGDRSAVGPGAAALAVGRCALRTAALLARRRVHQPRARVGTVIHFADGTSAPVYRETLIGRAPAPEPVFLAVGFELRWIRREWAHALFRAESVLNTVLFAGFPGLESKLWLRHDGRGTYRGLYQWDGLDSALGYVDALWWVLALVSVPGSIRYALVPGLTRDEVLGGRGPGAGGADWWRPTADA